MPDGRDDDAVTLGKLAFHFKSIASDLRDLVGLVSSPSHPQRLPMRQHSWGRNLPVTLSVSLGPPSANPDSYATTDIIEANLDAPGIVLVEIVNSALAAPRQNAPTYQTAVTVAPLAYGLTAPPNPPPPPIPPSLITTPLAVPTAPVTTPAPSALHVPVPPPFGFPQPVYDPSIMTLSCQVEVTRGDGAMGASQGSGRTEVIPPWGKCIPVSSGYVRVRVGGVTFGGELVAPVPTTLQVQAAVAYGVAMTGWDYPWLPQAACCNGPFVVANVVPGNYVIQPQRFSRRWRLRVLAGKLVQPAALLAGDVFESMSYPLPLTAVGGTATVLLMEETVRCG